VFGGTTSAQEAAAELGVAYASNRAAAAAGEVVALAVPFAMIRAALEQAHPLDGVVLWSCVKALEDDLSGLAVGFDTTAAEEVAKLAPRRERRFGDPPVRRIAQQRRSPLRPAG
jgi:predicted dinucleotide-binding enzyme